MPSHTANNMPQLLFSHSGLYLYRVGHMNHVVGVVVVVVQWTEKNN